MFANVTNDMTIARQEIFGPVLVTIPFDDDAEPIAMANDSKFGLGSAIWTRDWLVPTGLAANWKPAWSGSTITTDWTLHS